MSKSKQYRGEVPLHDRYGPEAKYAVEAEALLPTAKHEEEIARGLQLGLPGADSIIDRRIPTFSRGELPHFAGINTFTKAPYVEDVRKCGEYDVAILGAPFDGGTTYRSGTRFGPQGIRKISALYGTYSFELGVDLRESVSMCDLGDVFTIPANIEKTFDQVSKGVAHVYASGAFPVVLGGDHSLGFATVRGVAQHLNGKKLDMWIPRIPISMNGCIPRRGFTPRTFPTCRPRILCRSVSAVGKPLGPASSQGVNVKLPL
jgi:agmatinase